MLVLILVLVLELALGGMAGCGASVVAHNSRIYISSQPFPACMGLGELRAEELHCLSWSSPYPGMRQRR